MMITTRDKNIPYTIRTGKADDEIQLKELYRNVATIPGGLARTRDEVTDTYIHTLLNNALHKGKIFVAQHEKKLIGMIVTYRIRPQALAHAFKDTTVLVAPEYQGQGIGSTLIKTLLTEIENKHPEIMRIELFTRETNPALQLYKRLGFVEEGRFERRIKNPNGTYVADIAMAWCNKNFKTDKEPAE